MNKLLTLISICILLASAETLKGIFWEKFIAPKTGKQKALKISAFPGSIIAFLICYAMVPRLSINGTNELLMLGIYLSVFMALFDIFIGRVVMKLRWAKIFGDFNPASGNYLSLALLLLSLYPYAVMQL